MSTDLLWFMFVIHILAWFAVGKVVASVIDDRG